MKSAVALVSVLLFLFLVPAAIAQTSFNINLTGTAEVPGPGDSDGVGAMLLMIDGTQVSYRLMVGNIAAPTAAHIHRGALGVAGPIVVDLNPTFTNGVASGSVSGSADVIAEILANPANFYVNVHNSPFPDGAIRGQLRLETQAFATVMTGAEEAPSPGDPDGTGLALVRIDGMNVHFTLATSGIGAPTMAHIHRGAIGVAGPIVVDFNPTFANGFASGTVTASQDIINEILANPAAFYVNVHNAEFPAGAIRGQLSVTALNAIYFPVVANVRGVLDTNFLTDARIVNTGSTDAVVNIEFYASSNTALDGPTAVRTITVEAGQQEVLDDIVADFFNGSGLGAIRIVGNVLLRADARVLNDLRASGQGTTGFLIPGRTLSSAATSGVLPFLSSASSEDQNAQLGFRTNLGWFNPTMTTVTLNLTARNTADGEPFGMATIEVPALAQQQRAIFDWLTEVSTAARARADYYVTWTASAPIFVYAAVNDNKTGDAVFIE